MAQNGYVVPADPSTVVTVKKKTPQSSRNWVLIDAMGQSKTLDVDKYEIMHRVQIHARDLRILDHNLSYPSTILRRERAIVLNLEFYQKLKEKQKALEVEKRENEKRLKGKKQSLSNSGKIWLTKLIQYQISTKRVLHRNNL